MAYLLDTNVISELRKGRKANADLRAWFDKLDPEDLYLSVLTIGEIRRGIESIRRRDHRSAMTLEVWLSRVVEDHAGRILAVDQDVAAVWGVLNVPDPLPAIDGLLAATAKVNGLTLATRNTRDVERCGVSTFNPFER